MNNELKKRVDEVLYYVWDPIGVSDTGFTRSEYKDYVPTVITLLEKDDAEGIAAYLSDVEERLMGLSPGDKDGCKRIADLLLEHKEAIEAGQE